MSEPAPLLNYPVAQITIPADRQRKKAAADDALKVSIEKSGLINPIIIREDGMLVAGERRLDAFRQLGLPAIPVRIFERLSPLEAFLVELQENLARKQLSWQEETRAIACYHEMRVADFPDWTVIGTANDLGFSDSRIYKVLGVAKFLDDEEVASATTFQGAYNLIQGRAERTLAAAQARGLVVASAVSKTQPAVTPNMTKEEKTAALLGGMTLDENGQLPSGNDNILSLIAEGEVAAAALREATDIDRGLFEDDRILQVDFIKWLETYEGKPFDVIHCDFPYGKNYAGSNTRKTGKATTQPTYADKADVYFALVEAFLTQQDKIALSQAHCIFWFDMMHYTWTIEQFQAAGWRLVQPHPLLWTKGHKGVAADTMRRPRHCYETALFFSRGDRKIRKLVNDHFEYVPSDEDETKLHISQKPVRMLKHFLSLVVDEHSTVLDPTCGSGTALVAAAQLGASSILGLELDPSNADIAKFTLQQELTK